MASKRASLNLPSPPDQYDKTFMQNLLTALVKADGMNVKSNEEYQAPRFVLADTVTGTRYQVTIVSGALTLTAI